MIIFIDFLSKTKYILSFQTECSGPLEELSRMVNNGEPVILSHPLLSVVKMAAVEVTIPDLSAGPAASRPSVLLSLALCLLLLALDRCPFTA